MNSKFKFETFYFLFLFLFLFLFHGSLGEVKSYSRALAASQSEFRLPSSLNPLHYFIRLQPFINGNFSILGYTEIEVEVIEPTHQITLHIRDIITKNDTLNIYDIEDNAKTSLQVLNQTFDVEREFYIISLANELIEGKKYRIHLEFIGYLNDKLEGFYQSAYTDPKGNKRWLAATQFQPTDARLAFPCFDEPALKAKFSIELLREDGMSSISNMPLIETTPVTGQNGWFTDKFEKSVKMSTYLVAFMVSDFKYVETNSTGGTLIRVWAREEFINQTDYALQVGEETLTFFEDFFNISFPLPKLDNVALPDFGAGAMENWGLINYRETALLYDEEQSSISNKMVVGSIIAHELAHQWFGNLVTPYWWTDLWLNEGFATYMTSVAHEATEPSFNIEKRFLSGNMRAALFADGMESSHPISIPVGHPDEISDIFDSISYSKGASVIRMMNHFLTEWTFKRGVSNYLNTFSYSHAKQDDLWNHLSIQAEVDQTLPLNVSVKDIMDTWTLQMGYPVINVSLNGDGTATLTQERFLTQKNENSTDTHDYKWWVPITFTSLSNPDFNRTQPQLWVKPSEATKTIYGMPPKEDWVIFNIRQTGFYRVNYDSNNWNKLIKQLNEDHNVIDSNNRAQIIGDVFNLARAGMVPYSIPFSLVRYIVNEDEYVPIRCATYDIGYVQQILKDTELYERFKEFFLSLVIPHYEKIGFDEKAEDTLEVKNKRTIFIPNACYYKYKPCLDKVKFLYDEWMLQPQNESLISPNLRSTVYCYGVKYGGNKEWHFAWNQYLTVENEAEKKRILYSLGCTRNSTTQSEILKLSFKENGPIKKQDGSTAFRSILRDKASAVLAFKYLTKNWETIYVYMGSKRKMIGLLNSASGHIKTYKELDERDRFIATKDELQTYGISGLSRGREKIVRNIQWLEKNLPVIKQWLIEEGL